VVFGLDLDSVTAEEVECVFSEGAVEHGEDLGCYIVYCYFDVGGQSWVDFPKILVTEVEKLCCKFDAGCCGG